MNKTVDFVNRVVRQGNSLCVRIPAMVAKELKLDEGKDVLVSLMPQEVVYKYDEEAAQYVLKVANKVKALDNYSQIQKRLFIMLNFQMLEETAARDEQEMKRKRLMFFKEKKKEFGSKFIDEFVDFEKTFNKEAFVTEKNGTTILKPQYR